MVLSIFACALLLSLIALRWAMLPARVLLSLLAVLASTLFVFVLPMRLVRGFDLGTLLVVLPISISCWALAELVFCRREVRQLEPNEPDPQPQMSLRSMVFGFTAMALTLGLMSVADAFNRPRDLVGRFVRTDSPGEGIPEVAIWIHPMGGSKAAKFPGGNAKTVVAEYDGQNMKPEYILLRPGDTLNVKNRSQSAVSPRIEFMRNPALSRLLAPDSEFSVTLSKSELRPVNLWGTIRPDWRSHVFVTDSPIAVSNEDGEWRLPSVPPGRHRVRIWREGDGYVRQATLENGRLVFDTLKPKNKFDYRLDVGLLTRDIGECFLDVADLKKN